MAKYVLITSDTPEKVIDYLRRKHLDIKEFDFNPTIDLSSMRERPHNGSHCWIDCDNFIEGLEWEDYEIKPKTPEEAQKGMLSPDGVNRGWTKYRCKAYQGKERSVKWDEGKRITDNNPKGIVENCSGMHCDFCREYSPKTLEGRKTVLVRIMSAHENETEELQRRINEIDTELARQSHRSLEDKI